jgi:hypothetical protein
MACATFCPFPKNKEISSHALIAWRLVNLSEQLADAFWKLYEIEFLDLYHDELRNKIRPKEPAHNQNG